MVGSMISETPHTHTQITCRHCQSFSGLLYYTSFPMVGMTICLHVDTLVGVCVRVHLLTRRRACVCSTPPCNVLFPSVCMCPFKQREKLLVGSGGRIVNCGHMSEMYSRPGGLGYSVFDWLFKIKHPILKQCNRFFVRIIAGMAVILIVNLC